jgi:tetratricopeptide (TPR) repeat protein
MVAVTALAKHARAREFSAQLQLAEMNRYPDPDDGILRALAPEDRTASLDAWIDLNPDDWLARVWRLELSVVGDDAEVRRRHLDALLTRHGELPLAWWAASREHRRSGRTEAALESAERGLQLVPGNPWMEVERARALQARGAVGPALQAAQKISERREPPGEATLVVADLLLLSGDAEAAAATVDEILASRRSLNLAVPLALSHVPLLAQAGRVDEAVALAERARAVPLTLKRNVEVARLSLLLASLRSDEAQRVEDLGWARAATGAAEVPSDVRRELAASLSAMGDPTD